MAINLLQLMAAYNDLIALAEWASTDNLDTNDKADRLIRIDRRLLKLRMIASFFYEAMKVLEEFEQENGFKKGIKKSFSQEGLNALKRLRAVRCGKDPSIRHLLDRTRNLATFHYLKAEYKKVLALISNPSHKPFPVVIRYEKGDPRRWYWLAEHLKLETAFTISTVDGDTLLKLLDTIVERLDDLALVLEESCTSYQKIRKLGGSAPQKEN